MAGTQYTLRVINNSKSFWDMCVYQMDPDLAAKGAMSLAWFSKPAYSTTTVKFNWSIDYSFTWSETGELVPGVFFDATQVWPADPSTVGVSTATAAGNQIGFTYPGRAFNFTSTPTPGAKAGSLYIKEDGSIPEGRASVGIGMSGAGTFAFQGMPNVTMNLTPHPVYYLVAGSYVQGEVLDIATMTDAVSIQFPDNVYSMTATLSSVNTWSVAPSAQVNSLKYKQVIAEERSKMLR